MPENDDFSFFDDDELVENTPKTEDPAPATDPNPAVSTQEWNAAQERLAKAERFQSDLRKVIGGESTSASPDDEVKRFVTDPTSYREQIKQEAKDEILQDIRRENSQRDTLDRYRRENPDLEAFEPMVEHHAMQFLNEQRALGRVPTLEQYVEEGIKRTRAQLEKSGHQTSASKQVERLGMNLDLTGSQPRNGKPVAEVIKEMPMDKFEEYDQKIGARLAAQLYE